VGWDKLLVPMWKAHAVTRYSNVGEVYKSSVETIVTHRVIETAIRVKPSAVSIKEKKPTRAKGGRARKHETIRHLKETAPSKVQARLPVRVCEENPELCEYSFCPQAAPGDLRAREGVG